MSALLKLERVSRIHGSGSTKVFALRSIDLEVKAGELVAVMGPSGSGKSTLLHLAGGLDQPTKGDVVVNGQSVPRMKPKARAMLRRRHIGYVFQDFNLIPALTVAENVSMPLELDGMKAARAQKYALQALAEVEMEELAHRFADQLSGGQAQRVAIARAVVGPRKLLLADEPTGALDSVTGEEIMRIIRARVDAGAGGLLVTHDARFAAWADRTIFLRDGVMVDSTASIPPLEDLLTTRGTPS